MSVAGLIFRFAAIYIALIVSIVVIFDLLGMQPNTGINVGALVGAVTGACLWFASKNQRYLDAREKRIAVLGMWATDIGVQSAIVLAAGIATGEMLTAGPILLAIGVVALMHGFAIYFMVGFAGKQYAKQQARDA